MSLRAALQAAATATIAAVGDLASTIQYLSARGSDMDTVGGVTPVFHTYSDVEGVLANYSERQIDGVNILPRDQKLLIPAAEITFTPKTGDRARVSSQQGADLELWDVIAVQIDPAGALWVLQVRRIQ